VQVADLEAEQERAMDTLLEPNECSRLHAVEEFPEVPCKRCEQLNGLLYTVPLYLPATETGWHSLCGDCFRTVLQTEPSDGQAMHPMKHGRRSRR
jgi:hypothetical protein